MVQFLKFEPTEIELLSYLRARHSDEPILDNSIQDHQDNVVDPRALDWSERAFLRNHERFLFVKKSTMRKRVNAKAVEANGGVGSSWHVSRRKPINDIDGYTIIGTRSWSYFHEHYLDYKSHKLINHKNDRWLLHEYNLINPMFQKWVIVHVVDKTKLPKNQQEVGVVEAHDHPQAQQHQQANIEQQQHQLEDFLFRDPNEQQQQQVMEQAQDDLISMEELLFSDLDEQQQQQQQQLLDWEIQLELDWELYQQQQVEQGIHPGSCTLFPSSRVFPLGFSGERF